MEDTMNSEEEFLLKWNNHQNHLIGVFKEWLCDESFVDVTLVCGGEAVSGHKVVLAACSPLLNKILHDNPCRHPVVILNDVCSGDMKALLKFIYQGEVSVRQNELASFLRTAENLQIKGLAEDKEDKDKEDKKRKEKDDVHGSVRKKRKTDFKSSQCSQMSSIANQESSPKSQRHYSPSRDQFSSLNSHSGAVHSNSVNNQTLASGDAIAHTLEAEYKQGEQLYVKEEECVVKTEPLDYTGEMMWQDGNSRIMKGGANSDDICGSALSNASSSNSLNQHSAGTRGPFVVFPHGLDNIGNTNFLQKTLEGFHSGDELLKGDEESGGGGGGGVGVGGAEEFNTTNVPGEEEEEESVAGKRDRSKGTTEDKAEEGEKGGGGGRGEGKRETELREGENDDIIEILNQSSRGGAVRTSPSSPHFPSSLPDDDDDDDLSLVKASSSSSFSVVAPFSPMSSSSSSTAYYSMNGTLFLCANCPFQSRNPYTFNRHLRIHFGVKEFKCSVCDYASTRKDSLIRHFRVKHCLAGVGGAGAGAALAFLPGLRGHEEMVPFHQI